MATRQDLANAIRALSMDAVQKASSGHPGAPMGYGLGSSFFISCLNENTRTMILPSDLDKNSN